MRVTTTMRPVPPHRTIGILCDKDTVLLEDGSEWPYEKTPKGTKLFATKELVTLLWNREKIGEVLKYDGSIIKWRLKCPDRYKSRISWPNDALEVNVINSRSCPEEPKDAIIAYADWRDWVESYGGNIVGTMSSTSWSLFKATISGESWETPFEGVPGINHPVGGRLLPCKQLWSTFTGELIQYDLYSAYTRRLGKLAFGGIGSEWIECSRTADFDRLVEKGYCVYIEATISLRKSVLGPVPIRRARYNPRPTNNLSYPTIGTIKGIWTYEEVRSAERAGARIKFKRAFVHVASGRKYFHEDWLRIILEGREYLSGYSRALAKQTGNALWVRYAMRIRPAKTVWRNGDGKREWIKHPTRTLKRNQCMELADQLCGKIRSDLYEFAVSAGDFLLQGNTDGAWVNNVGDWRPPNDDWRIKRRADQIDIIDDATYRYWSRGEQEPTYIVPGVNIEFTEQYFNKEWSKHFA